MKQLLPYIIFPGTCQQALTFYKACLHGEITLLQRFAESPMDVPPELQERIFNSKFEADGIVFMASDSLPSSEMTVGSNFALFVNFSDRAEQHSVFAKLAEGGNIMMPLETNFGMLVDKFGIQWMVAHE